MSLIIIMRNKTLIFIKFCFSKMIIIKIDDFELIANLYNHGKNKKIRKTKILLNITMKLKFYSTKNQIYYNNNINESIAILYYFSK